MRELSEAILASQTRLHLSSDLWGDIWYSDDYRGICVMTGVHGPPFRYIVRTLNERGPDGSRIVTIYQGGVNAVSLYEPRRHSFLLIFAELGQTIMREEDHP